MQRLLLTGASGFIGQHVLNALASSSLDVHVISRRKPSSAGKFTWHEENLLDSTGTTYIVRDIKPDTLLHLAWYAEHGRYWESPLNLDWISASLNLARAFADAGGRRLLAVGSAAEYDWSCQVCHETASPLKPSSLYGTAKHALNLTLEAFSKNAGISYAWARLFSVFGPGEFEKRFVPSVILSFLRGEAPSCPSPELERDFLYVKDMAGALLALLRSDVSGPVNIASGEKLKARKLIGRISALTGRDDNTAYGTEPSPFPLVVADVTRLRQETGWQPAFSLEQALLESIEYWKFHITK